MLGAENSFAITGKAGVFCEFVHGGAHEDVAFGGNTLDFAVLIVDDLNDLAAGLDRNDASGFAVDKDNVTDGDLVGRNDEKHFICAEAETGDVSKNALLNVVGLVAFAGSDGDIAVCRNLACTGLKLAEHAFEHFVYAVVKHSRL